jgi:hypothetical protein
MVQLQPGQVLVAILGVWVLCSLVSRADFRLKRSVNVDVPGREQPMKVVVGPSLYTCVSRFTRACEARKRTPPLKRLNHTALVYSYLRHQTRRYGCACVSSGRWTSRSPCRMWCRRTSFWLKTETG